MGNMIVMTIMIKLLVLPFGILKGITYKLFARIHCVPAFLFGILSHLAVYCIVGYGCTKYAATYPTYHPAYRWLEPIALLCIGFVFFCSDCLFVIYARKANPSPVSPLEGKRRIEFWKIYGFNGIWWLILVSLFLIPSIVNSPKIYIHDDKTVSRDAKENGFNSFFHSEIEGTWEGKPFRVWGSPYGGGVLSISGNKENLNYQTFFHRWRPATFYWEEGKLFIKVNNTIFEYELKSKKYFYYFPTDTSVPEKSKRGTVKEIDNVKNCGVRNGLQVVSDETE